MSELKAYKVEWKRTPKSRTVQTWVRFAPNYPRAIGDAAKCVAEETCGEGVVVSVALTADPRGKTLASPAYGRYGPTVRRTYVDRDGERRSVPTMAEEARIEAERRAEARHAAAYAAISEPWLHNPF